MPFSKIISTANIKLYDFKITEVRRPEILIAGCGTGQHAIETAARFKNSNILAIDLSLSSLAYAKRKTDELSVKNITYMQADILDLRQLNKKFDIIECVGVLHHMNDPMVGWRILTDCLKTGGLMKIGLYSELARQHIIKIKEEIKKLGIGSSSIEIKCFRDIIMQSSERRHKHILNFSDFYSLSELRDLLFHVQEHRFTIPQIKDHIDKLGLSFCSFTSKEIISRFKLRNGQKEDVYNLDKWEAYEEANPRTFIEMYQFWCQKVR